MIRNEEGLGTETRDDRLLKGDEKLQTAKG